MSSAARERASTTMSARPGPDVDFSDESYVRLYTRDTVSWLRLGWEAQALLCLLLRQRLRMTLRIFAQRLAVLVRVDL